jgi:uncharacterized protein (DUF58 family)
VNQARTVSFWTAARGGLAGLTTRGRSFLAAGIAAGVCAVVLGQRDLLRVAVLLVALPVGALIALAGTGLRLGMQRVLAPMRVPAGSTARVRVELRNMTPGVSRLVMAEDRVPYALGPSPRFVVEGLASGRAAAITYTVACHSRGRYAVGPLQLRLRDPFGMCEINRSFSATDPLIVLPRVYPLASPSGGGRWSGSGEALTKSAASSGEDDLTTREYRHGDDLRRVHWRSTARRGELMMRQDEQPRLLRATVLLDARQNGHHGEGPAASLEWAVSAAASVAVHLVAQKYAVRLLTGAGRGGWTSATGESAVAVLDQLAEVTPQPANAFAAALTQLSTGGGGRDGLLVAVLGDLDTDQATALARIGRGGARGLAMLLATPAWAGRPFDQAGAADQRRGRLAALLQDAGWIVAETDPSRSVPEVWQQLNPLAAARPARAGA